MRAPVLLAAVLASACAGPRDVTVELDRRVAVTDPELVPSAVRRLAERVREELLPWPKHLPRSRDFPELPLVRVDPVEDLGRTGADPEALTRRLEHELRGLRLMRLSSDEEAVPPWLREPAGGDDERDRSAPPAVVVGADEPAKPGLRLRAWTDRAGRLRAELEDLVTGERLARVRSR